MDKPPGGDPSILHETVSRTGNLDLLTLATRALEDGKAENVVTIDLAGKTTFADAMIVCSGQTRRQVMALADRVVTSLKNTGRRIDSMEGYDPGDWILIDLGDVIVHIFRKELRSLYNLERIWAMPVPFPVEAAL